MTTALQLSKAATFEPSDILTGYGTSMAEGFDGQDLQEYLANIVPVVAVEYNTTTNIILFTLADGSQIVGTTSGAAP